MSGGGAATVLVVGAGINGAALARELTLSGCDVVVVDDHDLAAGTTAWSTRLVHGGLRYLEYGELALVRESLAERERLVRVAPHLVRPLPFYLPVRGRFGGVASAAARVVGLERLAARCRGTRGRGSVAAGLGLTLYDLLSTGRRWPRHRRVRPGTPGLPAVDREGFPRALVYVDAQLLHPERFTVELLVDAAAIAAERGRSLVVHTRARVRIDDQGRAIVEPAVGAPTHHRVDAVVNVTGAWVDEALAGGLRALRPADRRLIGGTKGSHLLLDHPALRMALAEHGVYAEAADGRPVFVLPFGPRLVLVGTTDLPWRGDPWTARTEPDEIDYLLAAVARLFPQLCPGPGDVVQWYCGVRPLPAGGAAAPAGITRRHMLVRHPAAPVPAWSVVGGKLTTCRSLAESSTRTILATLGRPVTGSSRDRRLPGAVESAARPALVAETARAAAALGVAADACHEAAEATVNLFGSRAPEWLAGAPVAGPPLLAGTALPAAVVRACVRQEWGRTLADLVERRLMLVFTEPLRRTTLMGIAAVLEAEGLLPRGEAAAEVDAVVADLAARYGKRVVDDRSGDDCTRKEL